MRWGLCGPVWDRPLQNRFGASFSMYRPCFVRLRCAMLRLPPCIVCLRYTMLRLPPCIVRLRRGGSQSRPPCYGLVPLTPSPAHSPATLAMPGQAVYVQRRYHKFRTSQGTVSPAQEEPAVQILPAGRLPPRDQEGVSRKTGGPGADSPCQGEMARRARGGRESRL